MSSQNGLIFQLALFIAIKHLIEANIMGQLKREINFSKLGFTLHILLQVSLSKHDSETFDKFLSEIEAIPEVTNAFLVTGQSADFILELVARNMDDYSEILLRRIGKLTMSSLYIRAL